MKVTGSKRSACLKIARCTLVFLALFAVLIMHTVVSSPSKAAQGDLNAQMFLGHWNTLMHTIWGTQRYQQEAITFYRHAAEQGLAEAQFKLGIITMLQFTRMETIDASDAIRWLRLAAAQNHDLAKQVVDKWNESIFDNLPGTYIFASKAGDSYFRAGNHEKARDFFRTATRLGDVRAQYMLGLLADDTVEAARLFRLAADQAESLDHYTQHMLALQFWCGKGVAQDKKVAARLFGLAAGQWNASVTTVLGALRYYCEDIPQDKDEAARLFRLSKEKSSATAQFQIEFSPDSAMLQDDDIAKDSAEAAPLRGLEAEHGFTHPAKILGGMRFYCDVVPHDAAPPLRETSSADDQFRLGVMLNQGRGDAQEKAEAARLYRLSADQGDARAMNNLGCMHLDGDGVPQDTAEAARLFRIASEQPQPNPSAIFNLGIISLTGDGFAQDEAKTVRLWSISAKLGSSAAQHGLGELLRRGISLELHPGYDTVKDEIEAIRLFRLAAEQGNAAAATALNNYLGG